MSCESNEMTESLRALRYYIIYVIDNICRPALSEIFLATRRLWYFCMRHRVVCYMISDVTSLFNIIKPPVSSTAHISNILF
jgi:hypothetical protein